MTAVGYGTVSSTIFALVNSQITSALKLPTALPNVAFTPPSRSAWCRLSIDWTSARQAIIGRARLRGDAVVSIFSPIGSGYRDAMGLAEQVRAVFASGDSGGVIFEDVRIVPVNSGAGVEAGWFQLNVMAAFFADEAS